MFQRAPRSDKICRDNGLSVPRGHGMRRAESKRGHHPKQNHSPPELAPLQQSRQIVSADHGPRRRGLLLRECGRRRNRGLSDVVRRPALGEQRQPGNSRSKILWRRDAGVGGIVGQSTAEIIGALRGTPHAAAVIMIDDDLFPPGPAGEVPVFVGNVAGP